MTRTGRAERHIDFTAAVFFDRYYNATRLHSALGYLAPDEFERRTAVQSSG